MVITSAIICLAITSAIISLAITSAKMWLLNLPQIFWYSGNNISHNGSNISHVNSNCHICYNLLQEALWLYIIQQGGYTTTSGLTSTTIRNHFQHLYTQYSLPTIVAKTTVTFNHNWLYLAYNNQNYILYYEENFFLLTPSNPGALWWKTFSHTPDEARSVGLAKACVS